MVKYLCLKSIDDIQFIVKSLYYSCSSLFSVSVTCSAYLAEFYEKIKKEKIIVNFKYPELLLFSPTLDKLDEKIDTISDSNNELILDEELQIYLDYISDISQKITIYNDIIMKYENDRYTNESKQSWILNYLVNDKIDVVEFIGFSIFFNNISILIDILIYNDEKNIDEISFHVISLDEFYNLFNNNQQNIIKIIFKLFCSNCNNIIEKYCDLKDFVPREYFEYNLLDYHLHTDDFNYQFIKSTGLIEKISFNNQINNTEHVNIKPCGKIFLVNDSIEILVDNIAIPIDNKQAVYVPSNRLVNIVSKNNSSLILVANVHYKLPG